jgi:hypothetical protein
MKEMAATRTEEKRSGGFGLYGLWAAALLLFYALSSGPCLMLSRNGTFPDALIGCLVTFYSPLLRAHKTKLLHKPIGLYFHIWCPIAFDSNGDGI